MAHCATPSSAPTRISASRCPPRCRVSSRTCSIRSRPGRTNPSSTRPRASWSRCFRGTSCSSRRMSTPMCATRSLRSGSPRNKLNAGGFMAEAVSAAHAANYFAVRQDWLDRRKEEILEPALPIIDPHHHLWDRGGWRYLLDELLADTNSGHNIPATVFVQARAFHRADGPEETRPVGETEFVNGVAAMTASGNYGTIRACAGIVG